MLSVGLCPLQELLPCMSKMLHLHFLCDNKHYGVYKEDKSVENYKMLWIGFNAVISFYS